MQEELKPNQSFMRLAKLNPLSNSPVKIKIPFKDIELQQDPPPLLQDNDKEKINNDGDITEKAKLNQQSEVANMPDSQSRNNDIDSDAAKLIIRDDLPRSNTLDDLKSSPQHFKEPNCIRIYCQRVMNARWFNWFMVILVASNAVLLAFQDYSYRLTNSNANSWRNDLVSISNPIFLSFYIIEFLITITAKGVILTQGTFFRNGWNILDFVIVCSGIAILVPVVGSIDIIQAMWLLIPLKLIARIRGTRNLAYGLFLALNKISNVILFLVFVVLIFALFGLQFYQGIFEHRCRITPKPINNQWFIADNAEYFCGKYDCPAQTYCGNPATYGLPRNWSESNTEAFFWGIPNFDSVYNGTLTIFQTITPTGWFGLMTMYSKGFDAVVTDIYFVGIICFVTFYVINLILAVITDSFMLIINEIEPENESPSHKVHDHHEVEGMNKDEHGHGHGHENKNKKDQHHEMAKRKQISHEEERGGANDNNNGLLIKEPLAKNTNTSETPMMLSPHGENVTLRMMEKTHKGEKANGNEEEEAVVFDNMHSKHHHTSNSSSSPYPKCLRKAYVKFQKFVFSPKFEAFGMLAILINAILLAFNRYPQPHKEEKIIRIMTDVLTFYFLLEIMMKIVAMGLKKYFREVLNVFDFLLVCITIIEFLVVTSGTQGSGLNIVNSLRSLKLLSLGRKWKSLRNLYVVLIHTLKDVRYFAVLLLVFIMAAALVGMQFFSYRARFIDEDIAQNPALGESPRINFDEFFNAYITALCIVLNEVWPEIMYNYMRTTSSVAALYFVIVVIIGNLILLKLFIAIIIENFSKITKKSKEEKKTNWKSIIEHKFKSCKKSLSKCWKGITMKGKKKDEKSKKHKKSRVKPKALEGQKSKETEPLNDSIAVKPNQNPAINNQRLFPSDQNPLSSDQNPLQAIQSPKLALPHEDDGKPPHHDDRVPPHDNAKAPHDTNKSAHDNKQDSKPKGKKRAQNTHDAFDFDFALASQGPMMGSSSSSQQLLPHKGGGGKGVEAAGEKKNMLKHMEFDPLTQKFIPKISFIQGKSLYLFEGDSKVRHALFWVIENRWYSMFIIANIVANSISVAIATPFADQDDPDQVATFYLDIITGAIFTINIIFKSITYGFWFNSRKSFLMSKWNILDLVIVICIWIDTGLNNVDNVDLSVIFIITAIRSMRPLTLITQNEGLKLAIKSIFSAIPSILNLTLLIIVFFFLFSIFGVAYFKGEFYHCDLSNLTPEYSSKIISKLDCMDYGGDWVNDFNNFDNIFMGMITIYKISTTDGWTALMFLGMDSVDLDINPLKNYNIYWSLFYILFVVLGVCFVLNFFVALVVDFFAHEKKRLGGLLFLSEEQREWLEFKFELVNLRPHSIRNYPQNALSKTLRSIVESNTFKNIITVLLVLNTLAFCLIWSRQDESATASLNYINIAFVVCFTLEAIMKIIAWSYYYFLDGWNCFDFIIVLLSLISKLLDYGLDLSHHPVAHIIRTFRCARILRLMIRIERLRLIYTTIVITLPAMLNIGAFLALVLFIYLNIGNSLFCFMKYGKGITIDVNFQTFHGSFLTLLKIATLEEWYAIFDDCVRSLQPNNACIEINTYNDYLKYGFQDCGTPWAYPFFLSFQYIFTLIFINLFIAVIIDAYKKCSELDKNPIQGKDLLEFKRLWNRYDPKGNALISHHNLEELILELQPPLGRPILKKYPLHLQKFIGKLHIPAYAIHEDEEKMLYHHFNDVLFALAKEFYQDHHKLEDDLDDFHSKGLGNIPMKNMLIQKHNKNLIKISKLKYAPYSHSELHSAKKIIKFLQSYVQKQQKPQEK